MNAKEFKQRFAVMCACLRFSPKVEESDSIWASLCAQEMTDEQIITAFTRAKNELKEFPAFSEFRELGTNKISAQDEIDTIVANVMACLSKGGQPESSAWVHDQCGDIGYEAIGSHWGWFDIMNGNKKVPREIEIRNFVKARVKEKVRLAIEASSNSSNKQIGGASNVARI